MGNTTNDINTILLFFYSSINLNNFYFLKNITQVEIVTHKEHIFC